MPNVPAPHPILEGAQIIMVKQNLDQPSDKEFALAANQSNWEELIRTGSGEQIREQLQVELADLVKKSRRKIQGYTVMVLYALREDIKDTHADKIYEALEASHAKNKTNILLILVSRGGYIEPAYQISQLCREWTKDKFIVCVPRHAKSAATLATLGADEVHMGPLGELGPIDPQLQGLPMAGVEESLRTIAKIAHEYPRSDKVWAQFLENELSVESIAWYQRICESAVQYGERLLIRSGSDKDRAHNLATHLVYGYKNHRFVIDREESQTLFGESVVTDSPELALAEQVYRMISRVDQGLQESRSDEYDGVSVIGTIHDGINLLVNPNAPKYLSLTNTEIESDQD